MKQLRSIAVAALTAMSLVAVAGCGSSSSSSSGASSGGDGGAGPGVTSTTASTRELTTLRVGIIPSSGLAPLYLGIQNGYFADEGLRLDLVPGATAAALIAQTLSGQLDMAFAPTASVIAADANGGRLKAIAAVGGRIDPNEASAAILVNDDSPIRSVSDLAGKKVAVIALKSELDVLLHNAVRRAGGDERSVQSVQIPFPEMLPALQSGRVDAIVTTEPFLTIAERSARVRSISDIEVDEIPDVVTSVFAADSSYIDAHRDLISAFQAANARSTEYARDHVDEARALLPKITSMRPELARVVKLGLVYDPDVDTASMQKMTQLMQGLGYVSNPASPDDMVQPRQP